MIGRQSTRTSPTNPIASPSDSECYRPSLSQLGRVLKPWIKQLLLGFILTLFIIVGKNLPLQMPVLLILCRQLVQQLLISRVAPPELLGYLSDMDLPTLP